MRSIYILFFGVFYLTISAQQINPLWYNAEQTNSGPDPYTPLVLIDSFHYIIACGSTYTPGPATGFITTKYDPNGQKIWERKHQTPATDFITAAATDREGAVYVGGITINDPFGSGNNQIIFKYSATGDTLWKYYLQVEQGLSFYISNLQIDQNNNLIIFGSYFDTLQNRGGLFVQKKSPDGALLWTVTHIENDYSYGACKARFIGDRWVFWGRSSANFADGTRLLCWQIGVDGQTLGVAASALTSEVFSPLHIDAEGSFFVTMYNEYKVVKYNILAQKEWQYTKSFMAFSQGQLNALTSDRQMNVYAVGYVRVDSFNIEYITSKLRNDGTLEWEHNLSNQGLAAGKCTWLNEGLLLTTGTITTNLDSNFYDCCFATYDTSGYMKGGVFNLEGKRNLIVSTALDGAYLFSSGISYINAQGDRRQFLCKYDIKGFVDTKTPILSKVNQGEITATPNPFSDYIIIKLDYSGESRSGRIQVLNAQGTIVSRKEVSLVFGAQTIRMETLGKYPPGIYQVSILTAQHLFSTKLVKIP